MRKLDLDSRKSRNACAETFFSLCGKQPSRWCDGASGLKKSVRSRTERREWNLPALLDHPAGSVLEAAQVDDGNVSAVSGDEAVRLESLESEGDAGAPHRQHRRKLLMRHAQLVRVQSLLSDHKQVGEPFLNGAVGVDGRRLAELQPGGM